MNRPTVEELWTDVVALAGDAVRGVTLYDSLEQETRMRDDLDDRFPNHVAEKVVDENIVDWYSEDRISASADVEPLEAIVRINPDVAQVAWAPEADREKGVLVALDRPADREEQGAVFDIVDYLNTLDESLFE